MAHSWRTHGALTAHSQRTHGALMALARESLPGRGRSLVGERRSALFWVLMRWRNPGVVAGVALGLGCLAATPALARGDAVPEPATIGELTQRSQTRLETADDAVPLPEAGSTLVELPAKSAAVEPDPRPLDTPAQDPSTGEAQVEDQSIGDEGDGSPSTPGESSAERASGRGLTITGAVLVGLGAASLGVMTYGLFWGARVDERGDAAKAAGQTDVEVYRGLLSEGTSADRLAIGAGAAGALAVVTGATLLGLGLRRRRTRISDRDIAWAPLGVARGGGFALRVRF